MVSPTPEEWNRLADKYVLPELIKSNKDKQSKLFGDNAKTELHNQVRDILIAQGKKGNISNYSIVKHSEKYLDHIREKLLEGKSDEEIRELRNQEPPLSPPEPAPTTTENVPPQSPT